MTDIKPVDWKVTYVLKPLPSLSPIEQEELDRRVKILIKRLRDDIDNRFSLELKLSSEYRRKYRKPGKYISVLEQVMMGYP